MVKGQDTGSGVNKVETTAGVWQQSVFTCSAADSFQHTHTHTLAHRHTLFVDCVERFIPYAEDIIKKYAGNNQWYHLSLSVCVYIYIYSRGEKKLLKYTIYSFDLQGKKSA